jgi:hypothetical protein
VKGRGRRRRKLSPQKERYAILRGKGKTQREAYERATGKRTKRSAKNVTQAEWERDPKVQMKIADTIRKDIDETEIRNRLAAQSRGEVPTKVVLGAEGRAEYDSKDAAVHAGKMLGMFTDHHRIEFAADREAALEEIQALLKLWNVEASKEEIAVRLESIRA